MAAALTVVDNADGTGATATVTGSGIGSANSVYVAKANGEAGVITPTLGGSRVGNGTVDLALAKGLWFAYLTSDGVLANLCYFGATDGLDAVATRVRRAIADTIRLLPIPPAARVYEQIIPDPENASFPCVMLTVDGVSETDEPGLSTRDDIGRPVKVMIADRCNERDHTKLDLYEYWRQSIDRCFRNQQLAGIPESKYCKIEPYIIIDLNMPQYQYMVSGLVVRAICREPRGVGM